MVSKCMVPDEVWDEQADYYELGLKHGNQIAIELGVSPQTVSRQMRKRGAIKGSRVQEMIADLVAMLDRKAKRAELMALPERERRRRIAEANREAMRYMVSAILMADAQGHLASLGPAIERIKKASSGKRRRRSKR